MMETDSRSLREVKIYDETGMETINLDSEEKHSNAIFNASRFYKKIPK
jgi:hypothetical protein